MKSVQLAAPSCPEAAVLDAFHGGRLPADELEAVGEHISSCDQCASRLQELDSRPKDDPIYARLRACWQAAPVLQEEGCAQLLEAVQVPDGSTKEMPRPAPVKARSRAPESTPLPREIGNYRILARLGGGGMGTVYRALEKPLNREVALKVIKAGALSVDAVVRFRREGQAIARLNHRNVVQIHYFGEHEDLPYFSMELIEGKSLAARLETGPLPWKEAAKLVQTLAEAVAFFHERQVVHRDLKPMNILMDKNGEPKISDFGLAKLVDSDDGQTMSEAVVGTPAYMAPEQAEGRVDAVGPAADIYALGVVLYEMLTGRTPFRGENKARTLELVKTTEPRPPSKLQRDVPAVLEAICLRCLQKKPQRRYVSAQALASDLQKFLNGEPTVVRPLNWAGRVWRTFRRHPLVAASAVLLIVVFSGLYAFHPNRIIESYQRKLRAGQRVILISETGKPRYSQCVLGADKATFTFDPEGRFAIYTGEVCLLELMPDPGVDRYKLQAKVSHRQATLTSAEAGLFVAHQAFPGPNADVHLFFQAVFNDIWTPRQRSAFPELLRRNEGGMNASHWQPRFYGGDWEGGDRFCDFRMRGQFGPLFHPSQGKALPHEISISVTPEKIWGTWDGLPVKELRVSAISQTIRESVQRSLDSPQPGPFTGAVDSRFVLRGGLGLYVEQGAASFSEVSITPLDFPGDPP